MAPGSRLPAPRNLVIEGTATANPLACLQNPSHPLTHSVELGLEMERGLEMKLELESRLREETCAD